MTPMTVSQMKWDFERGPEDEKLPAKAPLSAEFPPATKERWKERQPTGLLEAQAGETSM